MRRHQSKRPSRSLAESTSWFNNAGNFFAGFFEEQRSEQVRNQIETLLFGPMNVTRAVLPVMRKQRSGLLITISSTAGIAGQMFRRTPRQARHSRLSADRAAVHAAATAARETGNTSVVHLRAEPPPPILSGLHHEYRLEQKAA